MSEILTRGRQIQRQITWLATITVVTFVLLLATIFYVAVSNHELAVQGDKAHTAVCTLRTDLGARIAAGEAFLKLHPEGLGSITADEIRTSIEGQKRTYAALSTAGCK